MMKPKMLFKAKVPTTLEKFIGKTVIVPSFLNVSGKREKICDTQVKIEHIVGNRFTPQFYEINGKHLIGMLRFHAQMEGAKDLTEDQFQAFETMECHAEKMDDKEKQ